MAEKVARRGGGNMQWNDGGWFGGQFGSTPWLLLGGLIFVAAEPWLTLVWLGCFAAVNAVGCLLWVRRDRITPLAAYQILLTCVGVAGLVALAAADAAGRLPHLTFAAPGSDPRLAYLALLVVPALMALMFLLDRSGRGDTRAGNSQ